MAPKVYSNLFYVDGPKGSTKVVSHIKGASPRVTGLKINAYSQIYYEKYIKNTSDKYSLYCVKYIQNLFYMDGPRSLFPLVLH